MDVILSCFQKISLLLYPPLYLASIVVVAIQVNLCQKLSFSNQLTHNIMRDCSFNSLKNTSSELVVYKYCFECQKNNKKQFLYTTCSKIVFWGGFNEQSLVILWVNCFKNESFWHRFTCIYKFSWYCNFTL